MIHPNYFVSECVSLSPLLNDGFCVVAVESRLAYIHCCWQGKPLLSDGLSDGLIFLGVTTHFFGGDSYPAAVGCRVSDIFLP